MNFALVSIESERTAPELESALQRAVRPHPPQRTIAELAELGSALEGLPDEWVQISGPSLRYVANALERTDHVLAQSGLSGVADVLFHHSSMVLATGIAEGRGRTLHRWSPNYWIQTPEPRHLLIPSRVRPAGVLLRRQWLIQHLRRQTEPSPDLAQLVHRAVVSAGNAARLLVLPWSLAEEVIDLPAATAQLLDAVDFDLVPQLLMGLTWKNAWGGPEQAAQLELLVENAHPPAKPLGRLGSLARRLLKILR